MSDKPDPKTSAGTTEADAVRAIQSSGKAAIESSERVTLGLVEKRKLTEKGTLSALFAHQATSLVIVAMVVVGIVVVILALREPSTHRVVQATPGPEPPQSDDWWQHLNRKE